MDRHALMIVAVCALVTLLLRALPFLFFGGRRGHGAVYAADSAVNDIF